MNSSDQIDPSPLPESAAVTPPVTADVEWKDLGLEPEVLAPVAKAGFTRPTPVQAQAIPLAVEGHDVIASAQTGTGKTAAFALPMIQAFQGRQGTFGLVLAPTREIAQQIHQTVELLGGPLGVRSIVLIGGVDYRADAAALNTYPQVIVATPGRLCDHLDRGNVWLDYVEIVVLDEADRMLDMGFSAQLSRIMEEVPKERQTLLFSATFPPAVQRLAEKILKDAKRVSIGKPLSAAATVEQRVIRCDEGDKFRELMRLLRQERGSLMVFTRSKEGATRLWRSLHSAGIYDATYIHSDRLQSHREQALADFKAGKFRILVATDVAGRGIHVDSVAHVVNYDLPMEPEDYVHRIGRTGRAGQTGRSTTFATPRDRAVLAQIERLVGRELPGEFEGQRNQTQGGNRDSRSRDRDRGRDRNPDRSRGPRIEAQRPPTETPELEDALEAEGLDEGDETTSGDEPSIKPYTAGEPSQRRRRRRRRGGRGRSNEGGPVPNGISPRQENSNRAPEGGSESGDEPSFNGAGPEGGEDRVAGAPGEGGPGGGARRKRRRRRGGRGRTGKGPRGDSDGGGNGGGPSPSGGGGGGGAFPVD